MKKLTCAFLVFLISFCSLLSTFGCASPTGDTINKTALGTAFHLEVYDKTIPNELKTQINNLIDQTESILSTTLASSEIYTFNNAEPNVPVSLSDLSYGVLSRALDYSNATLGQFNPLVYPLTELWGFSPDKYPVLGFSVPTFTQIENAKALADRSLITLDAQTKTITKSQVGVKVGLGGMAKGFLTDQIATILKTNGFEKGYINFGGSSLYVLSLQSDDNVLGIKHPLKNYTTILELKNSQIKDYAVSTSGDYERSYTINNKTYSHIINPKTGMPIDGGIRSATVIGDNAEYLDALSTALCTLSYDKDDHQNSTLITYLNSILSLNTDLKVFVFYDDGESKIILTNKKQGEEFTLLDNSFVVKQI